MDTVAVDCLILGGGLSGLWLLNVLRRAGYSTLLIHDGPELGGIQSINSSGMIHGGPRLGIHLASREEQLPDMPLQWRNALCGSGELDLRDVRLLTPEQHLWCPGSDLRSRGTLLLAARNATGRTRHLTPDQYPALLRDRDFHGDVHALEHPVVDAASLLEVLARPHADCIYQAGLQDLHIQTDDLHVSKAVFIRKGMVQLRIHPRQVFLTAGAGNGALLQDIGINRPLMASRPIHMVSIRHPDLPDFWGHCHDRHQRPRLTITTHPVSQGKLWYIAGQAAEEGVDRDETLQIQAVKDELRALLPWVNLKGARFRSYLIERIYPLENPPWQPVRAFVRNFGNNWLVWPTRMVLAPNAGHQVLAGLAARRIQPATPQPGPLPMMKPRPGRPLWE